MDITYLLLLSPLISLTDNVISYVICIHANSRYAIALLCGLLSGLIVDVSLLTYLSMLVKTITAVDVAVSLATYITCSFCFWAFLNLNITSLRIRLVRELLSKRKIGLSDEELSERYTPQELIRRRIDRLAASGQIINSDGKWHLNSKMLILFERVFFFLNKLIIPYKADNTQEPQIK